MIAEYGSTYEPIEVLWRPLVVVVAFVILITAGGRLITRDWHLSAFLATLVVFAIVGLWELLALASVAWVGVAWWSARQRMGLLLPTRLTPPLNAWAAIWFIIATTSAVSSALPRSIPAPQPAVLNPAVDAPNIYVVLLDGYPRADSLLDYFGYDNEPFLAELASRGFAVNPSSRSDYTTTFWTLPTMLHTKSGEVLDIFPWPEGPEGNRYVRELIDAAPALRSLEAAGYTTFSVGPAASALVIRSADHVRPTHWLSSFEVHLFQTGILNAFATDFIYAEHRAGVLNTFTELERIAGDAPEPRFVFAHASSPHAPIAFAADGSPAEPAACEPTCSNGATTLAQLGVTLDELSGPFMGQIEFLNARVLAAMDSVISDDPDAVIMIFSDHGSRVDPTDPDESFRNLFAARTPGRSDVFSEGDTPMSMFAALFNAYFDAGVVVER